jgi:hypothetical protein
MYLTIDLQKFIYDSINDCDDNNTVYFTSKVELDIIINNLYSQKDFLSIANILETLSILDRNTYMLENNDQYMIHYIILYNMFFSCLLYNKVGLKKEASSLANIAYNHLLEYYDVLHNKETPNAKMIEAIYLEIIGDFSIFIDRVLLAGYYDKASTLYKDIDNTTQYGETCDWYWCFTKDRFIKLVLSCYGITIDIPKLGIERIKFKQSILNDILDNK